MIRNATGDDMNFLIEGIEEIRKFEAYEDPSVKEEDLRGIKDALSKGLIRIVEVDGEPAGYLHCELNKKLMFIDEEFLWALRIYVREDYRGKGLAKQLWADAERIASTNNLKRI